MKKKFDIADFVKTQTVQSATEQLFDWEKQRRKRMILSQRDLANKLGVSYASIK